ncbi:MBL fold metallo-hydrolase [Marinoscillum sp. MHG1-6]|uniref:MBL fold metallo-hydrolase n=1 Tax=Marinoscillum sp. MHG1-6 TaxID=2959627 RepID=UPI002157BB69|nr:MBL fold metallo-hydrolase [Marinoscillum sp. MHG1-6]
MMNIKSFVFNPFYENTYLLWDETKEAIIIDPGCYEKYERDELIGFVASEDLKVVKIVNTHCHVDHVLGNYYLKDHFKCPLWIPENEAANYESVSVVASRYGIHGYTKGEPDELMKEGDTLKVGNEECSIIEAPGHSPGHQLFYFQNEKVLIGGDVLFRQSIGRTDLPGGDHDTLLNNIKQKVYTLPEDTVVYPGHGPETTIGFEKVNNPFVRG